MISQQINHNAPNGTDGYDNVSKDSAPSGLDSVQLRTEGDGNPSELSLDGLESENPTALKIRQYPFPKVKHPAKPLVLRLDDTTAIPHPVRFSRHHGPTSASIRAFIGGLSHCYNNLLMGIWGNATLIGMVVEKSDPFQQWLSQLEDLIHNGSNLMQLLFGYIAERRSAARQLRYKQLLIEMNVYRKSNENGNEFDVIEDCICELSHASNRAQMSAIIARVIDRMQFLLQSKRCQLDETALGSAKAIRHLDKIDDLLNRGVSLILNLQYYAGARIPVRKSVCLKSMVQRKVGQALRRSPGLNLTWRGADRIPPIDADLYQVEHAVDQVLNNAIEAISGHGKIELEINSLYSEAPHDRCGVHMLKDYAVITFRDTGKGMSTPLQSKIFDPFFTGIKGQGRTGLGLAAAAGIVRAHGGYIQVRSKSGNGSTFKVYLPIG